MHFISSCFNKDSYKNMVTGADLGGGAHLVLHEPPFLEGFQQLLEPAAPSNA